MDGLSLSTGLFEFDSAQEIIDGEIGISLWGDTHKVPYYKIWGQKLVEFNIFRWRKSGRRRRLEGFEFGMLNGCFQRN